MSVSYNGSRIIPAPLVTVSKDYQTTGDGTKIGSLFNITVQGTIVAFKGSPNSSGTFHTTSGYPADEVLTNSQRLAAIIRKQEALRDLFSEDGKSLEFQSADGSQPMKANPRIIGITFDEGLWFNTCNFTITCEADVLHVNGAAIGEDSFPEYISSASESWTIETQEEVPEDDVLPRTYRVTHTVSATGKRFFNSATSLSKPAWQQARDYVLPKLGFDSVIALGSGVNNLPEYYGGYNHVRSENLDEVGGGFSVTETWLMSSGTALEDFTVTTQENNTDGVVRVGVAGNIAGLEQRDSDLNLSVSKYTNAASKFDDVVNNLHTRAETYSSKSLNIFPITQSVGRNPTTGRINYSYEFDNRPTNLVTGTKSESITMTNNWNEDIFAAIGVLGRLRGPVLQSIDTKTATTRSLNIQLNFGPSGTDPVATNPRFNTPYSTEIQAIVDAAAPIASSAENNLGEAATVQYLSQQRESWDPYRGHYTISLNWTFE